LCVLLSVAACSKPQSAINNEADVAALSKGGSDAIPRTDGTAKVAGAWHYAPSAAGGAATFGTGGAYPDFAIRCEPLEHSIALVRDAAIPAKGAMLHLTTSEGKKVGFPALPANENRAVAIARVTSGDSFLRGALVDAKDQITITLDGGTALTIPADPAIASVITACPK
jgi:hypothetical protein